MAELVDLKMTDAEKKSEWGAPENAKGMPDYPYGLRLSLGAREMVKLGSPRLGAGQELEMTCRIRVASVSEDEVDGKIKRSVQLQVEAIGLPNVEKSVGEALYGAGE